jgi:8-oxo-dGTP diphosphatase
METKKAKMAAVALIFNEDKSKVLGVSRKDDSTLFGLPGGKVDVGESTEEGMIREVKEETGLDIKSSIPIFVREDGEYVAIVYMVTEYSGKVFTRESGIVEWVTFEILKRGAFSEYNSKLEEHLKLLNIINDNSFSVHSYTLVDENEKWVHWSKGLKMIITKGGVTLKLEEDEIQQIVKTLPRTFGGTY